MGCFIVPTTAAIVHFFLRKKNPALKASKYQLWLNQLFLGGAIFGIVDHAWNGELFFSKLVLSDLLLGVYITVTIFVVWAGMVVVSKAAEKYTSSVKH